MNLTPAYGRDYKSAKDVLNDWEAGKDFVVADVMNQNHGAYINKQDALDNYISSVNIRYKKLRAVTVIKVK